MRISKNILEPSICSMTFYDLPSCSVLTWFVQCSSVFWNVLSLSMMFHDLLWCSLVFHDVLGCPVTFYLVLWPSVTFWLWLAVSFCYIPWPSIRFCALLLGSITLYQVPMGVMMFSGGLWGGMMHGVMLEMRGGCGEWKEWCLSLRGALGLTEWCMWVCIMCECGCVCVHCWVMVVCMCLVIMVHVGAWGSGTLGVILAWTGLHCSCCYLQITLQAATMCDIRGEP